MSDNEKPRFKVSREGVVLIKSFEGFHPHAVRNGDGWVIGYGHTASARSGASVTEAEAELLLQYDLKPVVSALNAMPTVLNQHQFDALASFIVSIGLDAFEQSDVARHLQEGAPASAAEAMMLLPVQPRADAGLHRRAAERALFNSDPAYPTTLTELLAAPLALFPATPADAVDARAVALATLLGEGGDLGAFPASPDAVAPPEDWRTPIDPLPSPPEAVVAPEPEAAAQVMEPTPEASPEIESVAAPLAEAAPPEPTVSEPVAAEPPVEPSVEPLAVASGEPAPAPEPRPASVVRHEPRGEPTSRFDWSEAGMYVFMGVIGLIACAFAAAAFRWSLLAEPAEGQPASLVGVSLALTGLMCVVVSAWNLYVHWRSRA